MSIRIELSLLIVIFPPPTFFMLSNKAARSIWIGGVPIREGGCPQTFFNSDFWSGLTIMLDDRNILPDGIR